MEPLEAFSLAAAVAQFIDFGLRIANNAREIYGSLSGATDENRSLEAAVREVQDLTDKLVCSQSACLTEEDRTLNNLVLECQSVSSQLLVLLDKCKAKDPKSKVQSALAAVKSRHYEREKSSLQKRLEQCRLRLERLLCAMSRSMTKEQLENIILHSKKAAVNLAVLRTHMENLRHGTTLESIGPKAQQQIRELLEASSHVYNKAAERTILDIISYSDMHSRVDAVAKAHQATFEWISEESNDGVDAVTRCLSLPDERNREAAAAFVQWLSSGNGIFHIAGKLGSGKSTLMKYLCGHRRVRKELQKWAAGKKLVVAKFFFWRYGSPFQRSLEGLFRTLLRDILENCPHLIPKVLPRLWDDVKTAPGYGSTGIAVSSDEVHDAFKTLLSDSTLHKTTKLCFFIDGLDEFEETAQEDYKSMVQLLLGWTKAAPHAVKLCVSSREYNVFINSFSINKRLRLQDLTRADMKRFIRDKLHELVPEDLDRMVDLIADKSNGIFLWVALVVRSIRARLEDGCSLSMIENEVNSLPDELEGLFRHLLASIDKAYKKEAYQTFAIMELYKLRLRTPFTLLAYSFLEEYNLDSEFAQKQPFPLVYPNSVAKSEREEAARRRLNASCQGLLEQGPEGTVTYTHRSVPDFLESHLRNATELIVPEFDPVHALSQLWLAEVRIRPRDPYWLHEHCSTPPSTPRIDALLWDIMVMRGAKSLDCPPFPYLESLKSAASSAIPRAKLDRGRGGDPSWRNPGSLLIAAARCGVLSYLDWALQREPCINENYETIHSIAHVAVMAGVLYFVMHPRPVASPYRVFEVLLRRGISPNVPLRKRTLWECVIFHVIINTPNLVENGFVALPSSRKAEIGKMIQIFLEYGATPKIHISLELGKSMPQQPTDAETDRSDKPKRRWGNRPPDSNRLWNEAWEIQAAAVKHYGNCRQEPKDGLPRPVINLHFWRKQGKPATLKFHVGPYLLMLDPEADLRFFNFAASRGGEMSFHDFIKFWNFDNEKTILQLFDRKGGAQASSHTGEVETLEEHGGQAKTLDIRPGLEAKRYTYPPTDLPDKTTTAAPTSSKSSSEKRERAHMVLFLHILQSRAAVFMLGVLFALGILQILELLA